MPFVDIVKSGHISVPRGVKEIRMGISFQNTKNHDRGVYFGISPAVLKELGWTSEPGIQNNKRDVFRVKVAEGIGSEAGFLLLSHGQHTDGYSMGKSANTAQSYSMSVSASRLRHYLLDEGSIQPAPVNFSVDAKDKTILIECPKWLRYNPQSYVEPPLQRELMVLPPTKVVVQDSTLNRKARRSLAGEIAKSLR